MLMCLIFEDPRAAKLMKISNSQAMFPTVYSGVNLEDCRNLKNNPYMYVSINDFPKMASAAAPELEMLYVNRHDICLLFEIKPAQGIEKYHIYTFVHIQSLT